MTKDEIQDWIKSSEVYCRGIDDFDGSNEYRYIIYKNNGKLFRLDYCNGTLTEKWEDGKGYIRNIYEPYEVIESVRMVEVRDFIRLEKPIKKEGE